MSDKFDIRVATPADAETISGHRARMFLDMRNIPENLFDAFHAKSSARLFDTLASGEYVGWLASPKSRPDIVIGGAGVQLRRVLPHPLAGPGGSVIIAEGRHAVIQNVFTEPDWRRRGIATL